MSLRRAAALLLAAPLLSGAPPAQAPSPAVVGSAAQDALDLVPPEAYQVLLMRDPFLTELKLKGLLQRFGMKRNPFGDLQAGFGLPKLPMDPRGIALVSLPGAGNDKPAELLLVPVKDPKGFAESLQAKAKAGDKDGLLAYATGRQPMLLAWKGGWAVLAPAAEAPTLRRFLKATATIRRDLGDLDAWAKGGDLSGISTPKGLEQQFSALRRTLPQASAAEDPFSRILGQMQRELTHVAYRGELDADGNLTFTLRCKLLPGGLWSSYGRDLRAPGGLGLMGLGGDGAFFLAAGGSLPSPWMDGLGQFLGDPMSLYALEQNDPDGALKARTERLAEGVQSLAILMGADGKRSAVIRTGDSKAYLEEYRSIQEGLSKAMQGGKAPALGFTTEAATVEGYPALVSSMDPPMPEDMDPAFKAEMKARWREKPDSSRLALDGERVLLVPGLPTAESLKRLLHPERALADSDRLAALAKQLPDNAHFYAFVDPTAMQSEEAKGEAALLDKMDEDLKAQYPRMPQVAPAPPLGLSLRFDLDGWVLDGRLPVETQVAFAAFTKDAEKHNMARVRLRMEQNNRDQKRMQERLGKDAPKGDEAPVPDADDGKD